MRLLHVVEGLFVAAFVALAAVSLRGTDTELPALDVEDLASGPAEERWMGIFLQGKHVGYAVGREAPTKDGGRVYQQQSAFKLAAMGEVQQIVAAGTAVADAQGRVRAFDFMLSAPTKIVGRGEVREGAIHLEIVQGGDVRTLDVPIREAPVLSQTLGGVVRGRTLAPGDRFTVPWFDPITLQNAEATVLVEAPEVLPDGEAAFWLRVKYGGMETRRLVDAHGGVVREEGGMGLTTTRMAKEEAMAVSQEDPPDLVAMSAAPATGPAPSGSRVALRVSGIEMDRIPNEPPLQTVDGDVVTVSMPLLQELPRLPVEAPPEEAGDDTDPTLSLPATHPEIVARARAVIGDAPDRLEAARRLYDFVYTYVQKKPTIGVPNGLEVLRTGEGDCNEHTALYVSLARAAGIPARIAAGLVYSSRLGHAFYYHAWPEVKLGGPTTWVPIDPTLGQFPADGSHLKVLNGDLDRQVEIMALMGRIRLEILPTR